MQKIAVAVLGICLLIGAGWASVQEASPYLTDSLPEADRIAAITDGTSIPGLAITTQTAYLLSCYDLMRSPTLQSQGAERDTAFTATCRVAAQKLAAQSANSLAWFVAAYAAAKTGSRAGMKINLRNSYLAGPHEQWLALLRIPLAEANRALLDPDLQVLADLDLADIVKNQAGVDSLANRYSNDPAFRERLTSVIEKMADNEQRQFVNRLRRSIQTMAGQQS